MRVLLLRKCLLLCLAHSYIALQAPICVSPRSGSSRSPSLLLAGFSPFILAHVIWKKKLHHLCKERGPRGREAGRGCEQGKELHVLAQGFLRRGPEQQPGFLMSPGEQTPPSPAPAPPPRRRLAEMGRYANSLSFYTGCSCRRAQGSRPELCFPVVR